MSAERKYIVAYGIVDTSTEHQSCDWDYDVFIDGNSSENESAARKRYAELLKEEDTHSASICQIVESTDY